MCRHASEGRPAASLPNSVSVLRVLIDHLHPRQPRLDELARSERHAQREVLLAQSRIGRPREFASVPRVDHHDPQSRCNIFGRRTVRKTVRSTPTTTVLKSVGRMELCADKFDVSLIFYLSLSVVKSPPERRTRRASGHFADMSAKLRKIFGILNRIKAKYILAAAVALLFAPRWRDCPPPAAAAPSAAQDSTSIRRSAAASSDTAAAPERQRRAHRGGELPPTRSGPESPATRPQRLPTTSPRPCRARRGDRHHTPRKRGQFSRRHHHGTQPRLARIRGAAQRGPHLQRGVTT